VPIRTLTERRAAFRAWVYAPFVTERFLGGVLGSRSLKVHLSMFEQDKIEASHLVFASEKVGASLPQFERITELNLAGQPFRLGWNRGPGFVPSPLFPRLWLPVSVALSTVSLVSLVLSLQIFRERAEALVVERTRELRNSEQTYRNQFANNSAAMLLTFSRGSGGERLPLQVGHLVREIGGFVREMFPRNIAWRMELAPDLPPVLGDATQLHQLLLNICVNARDAMPNGGILKISAQTEIVGADEAAANPPAKPGPYVLVSIVDTGEGIPPDIIGRIFEPFFTTKEFGKGTGLGLSTALGIVRSHGGFITVTSTPGAGTKFCVYFPAAPTESASAPTEPSAEPRMGRGELILVVDDEPAVCRATRIVLERHGYRVLTAANGEDALEVFRSQGLDISLVLTDVMMPAMDGIALIGELRRERADVKIVATTGMISADKLRELAARGVMELLQKPSSPNDLLEIVSRAFSRQP